LAFILDNWLALVGLLSGLLCVWLLIRENILTFPIGLIYAVVTVVVMANNRLYADVLLNFYYVLMNAYGWYFWLFGARHRRAEANLLVAWLPRGRWPLLVSVIGIGTLVMGGYFYAYTDADLPFPDSFTTVTSFVAMWMSARKYIESWVLWLVVNVISVVLYVYKASGDPGLYYYALLYAVYIWMAAVGWRAWRVHLVPRTATGELA